MSLYDTDFYAWTQQTAERLRRSEFASIDLPELIEEVSDMGNRHKDQLESRLRTLIMHMLKWDYQPSKRSRSWVLSIKQERIRIKQLLRRMPSLRPALPELLPDAYESAVVKAAIQSQLVESSFPSTCPYDLKKILEDSSYVV